MKLDSTTRNIWFSSDPHLGHKNILKYCDRPFETIEEHDIQFVKNWNSKVKTKDIGFILGDIAFTVKNGYAINLLTQLNGEIVFIEGNHDNPQLIKELKILGYQWEKMLDLSIFDPEMDYKRQHITLCHYPMMSWNHSFRGSWNLHGHHHNNMAAKGEHVRYTNAHLDVGVDAFGHMPVSYEKIKTIMTKRFLNKK